MIALFGMAAHAGGCQPTTLLALAATPAPAVIVLGERRGTQPDLARASRLIARLRMTGQPVTVGLQAVAPDLQPVLDRWAAGEIEPGDLPGLLDWEARVGFPYGPYAPLLGGAVQGDALLAVGEVFAAKPVDAPVPLPPGYGALLADGMAGHPMPPALESAFVQAVAWLDHRIARTAIENWKGEGYLVLVVDRAHVEGGKGVAWQAQRLTSASVTSALLAGGGACYDGDRHLAP